MTVPITKEREALTCTAQIPWCSELYIKKNKKLNIGKRLQSGCLVSEERNVNILTDPHKNLLLARRVSLVVELGGQFYDK